MGSSLWLSALYSYQQVVCKYHKKVLGFGRWQITISSGRYRSPAVTRAPCPYLQLGGARSPLRPSEPVGSAKGNAVQHRIIPEDALGQHIAVLGKTGSGKTYAAKGIVERLLEQKRQVCVLDPTGAWWGLRLDKDGEAKGYDVVLLGGAHADIPLAERSGAACARPVTQPHASVLIYTSCLSV